MFPVRGSTKDCGISLLSGATQLPEQRYSDERSAGERLGQGLGRQTGNTEEINGITRS